MTGIQFCMSVDVVSNICDKYMNMAVYKVDQQEQVARLGHSLKPQLLENKDQSFILSLSLSLSLSSEFRIVDP